MDAAEQFITVADLDTQIEDLRTQEQAMKRQARDLERRVKEEVRPKLYALVELRKGLRNRKEDA